MSDKSSRGKQRSLNLSDPDREDLIKAYIQYSEESRYRDQLMHNSYYFVLISLVLLSGTLTTIFEGPKPTSDLVIAIVGIPIGVAAMGIGIVMKTYNRKRINAENQRQAIEHVLSRSYPETGLFDIEENDGLKTSKKDNPFLIQEKVLKENEGVIEWLFIDGISISVISVLFFIGGIASILITVGALLPV